MYRTAPPDQPDGPDPRLVVPGEGLRGIVVGRATPDEVVATFGSDMKISRHSDGDVFEISYDYSGSGQYEPRRSPNESRPSAFRFKYGLLEAISVGVYQKDLYLAGGVRIGSTKRELLEAFGPPCETLTYVGAAPGPDDDIETLRYRKRGLQVAVHHDGRVASFVVFQTRRFV